MYERSDSQSQEYTVDLDDHFQIAQNITRIAFTYTINTRKRSVLAIAFTMKSVIKSTNYLIKYLS